VGRARRTDLIAIWTVTYQVRYAGAVNERSLTVAAGCVEDAIKKAKAHVTKQRHHAWVVTVGVALLAKADL
jgi:hypothetical protein